MPCSNAKQRARSRSSSSFRVFRSVSDAVYSQIRVVLTHLSHGSSPEHLTRRLLHALHLPIKISKRSTSTSQEISLPCAWHSWSSPRGLVWSLATFNLRSDYPFSLLRCHFMSARIDGKPLRRRRRSTLSIRDWIGMALHHDQVLSRLSASNCC